MTVYFTDSTELGVLEWGPAFKKPSGWGWCKLEFGEPALKMESYSRGFSFEQPVWEVLLASLYR